MQVLSRLLLLIGLIVLVAGLVLLGKNVIDMIVTDLAVFQRPDHSSPFRLVETAPGVTAEDVRAKTTAHYAE